MTAPRTPRIRVPGHTLVSEGAPHDDNGVRIWKRYGGVSGRGRALCTCGAASDPLPSAYSRKAWHREHKTATSTPVLLTARR